MKILCPNCSAVYNLNDDKVPENEVTVRCKKCHHKIHIKKSSEPEAPEANGKEKKKNKKAKKQKHRLKFGRPSNPLKNLSVPSLSSAKNLGKNTIYKIIKFASLLAVVLLVFLISWSVYTWFTLAEDNQITFKEVERSLELSIVPADSIQKNIPDIKVPKVVEKYLGGKNTQTFVEWIEPLDNEQIRDFITNLEDVIRIAEKKDRDHIFDYINEYKKIKFRTSLNKEYKKYSIKVMKAVIGFSILAMVGIVALIIVILALLSQAKNTTLESRSDGHVADSN